MNKKHKIIAYKQKKLHYAAFLVYLFYGATTVKKYNLVLASTQSVAWVNP